MQSRIVRRATAYASPWVDVETLEVQLGEPRGIETFYAVRTHPYVVVLAVTEGGRIPLVLQYRAAVDERVLELPSGHLEPGESPEAAARRELREETGCDAGELVALGEFFTEPARLTTRPQAFFVRDVKQVEPGGDLSEQVEVVFVTPRDLRELIVQGRFRQAAHAGIVAMAAARGLLKLDDAR